MNYKIFHRQWSLDGVVRLLLDDLHTLDEVDKDLNIEFRMGYHQLGSKHLKSILGDTELPVRASDIYRL